MPALPKEFSKKQDEEEGERDLSLVDKLFSRKSDPFVESRPSSLHPHPHPSLPLHRETSTHSHPHPLLLLTPSSSSSSQVIESRMISSSSSSSSKTIIKQSPPLPPHLIVDQDKVKMPTTTTTMTEKVYKCIYCIHETINNKGALASHIWDKHRDQPRIQTFRNAYDRVAN